MRCGDRVLCDWAPRTESGPGGSSSQRQARGAADRLVVTPDSSQICLLGSSKARRAIAKTFHAKQLPWQYSPHNRMKPQDAAHFADASDVYHRLADHLHPLRQAVFHHIGKNLARCGGGAEFGS